MSMFNDTSSEAKEFIDIAINLAYKFLNTKLFTLKPTDIISLGNFIYGAKRFPRVVDGLDIQFGLSFEEGDASFSENEILTFSLNDYRFRWLHKIYTYDRGGVGGDSYEISRYELDLNSYINPNFACKFHEIESNIDHFFNKGAELYIEDMTCLSMDELGYDEEVQEEE